MDHVSLHLMLLILSFVLISIRLHVTQRHLISSVSLSVAFFFFFFIDSATLHESWSPRFRNGKCYRVMVVSTTPNPQPGGLETTIRLAPYPFPYLESTNVGLEGVFPPPCDSIFFRHPRYQVIVQLVRGRILRINSAPKWRIGIFLFITRYEDALGLFLLCKSDWGVKLISVWPEVIPLCPPYSNCDMYLPFISYSQSNARGKYQKCSLLDDVHKA
jgi:hypothetical protein